jgi:hypothetical protein
MAAAAAAVRTRLVANRFGPGISRADRKRDACGRQAPMSPRRLPGKHQAVLYGTTPRAAQARAWSVNP